MRGFFSSELAKHDIEIKGESWRQGDLIDIKVTTQLNESSYDNWSITLAYVDIKKLKKKNDNSAFQILSQNSLNSADTQINFKLSNNAQITDNQFSLMVVCGEKNNLAKASRLELSVSHHPIIEDFIKTLELFHRLKLKNLKNKKDSLDAKFALPKTREYGAIEQLNIIMSYRKNDLHSKCIFKVKKLEYNGAGVEATQKIIEEDVIYPADSLTLYGSFNQEVIKTKMSEVLDRVKTRTLI